MASSSSFLLPTYTAQDAFSMLPLPRNLSSGISLSRKPSDTLEDDYLPHACLDLCPCHILLGSFSSWTVTSVRAVTGIYLCSLRTKFSARHKSIHRVSTELTGDDLMWPGPVDEVTGKDDLGVIKTESRTNRLVGKEPSIAFIGDVRVCTGWSSQHIVWGISDK